MKKTKLIGIAAALVAAISLNFVSCNNDTTTEEEATSIGVTGIVSGVVYDSQTKQGIEGVTVTIGSHSAETNSSGVYVIKNVEPTEENDLTGYSVVMHKDNYLDTVATATVVVKPKEYTSVDPYAESTLTKEWIGALKATNKNETNGTSTSASGSETTNVNITYSNDVVNVAMEKISYAYGISVASVEMVPLTSGITGTVYLDDIKNDSIEGTTVAKKAIVSFVYDKDGNNATTDDEYVFKENAKTNDDGVFEYYGLPTGVLSSTVFYKVDYTDETTKNYYTANGTLNDLNKKDTLIVNDNGDTAKYFQAGKVNAVLTDVIKVTKDNFNGKVLNVTDSIELTFDHQLSKLTVTVGGEATKVALVKDSTANTCTATITPIDGAFNVGPQPIALSDALATNGTNGIYTYDVDVNFVEFKFVGMSVVNASRTAVTSSQFLELEFNMEVAKVTNCTVGGKLVDPIISGVYVDVPFNDTVNTGDVNVEIGTITAKAADSLSVTGFNSQTYNTAKYYSEQSNYIASTNLTYNSSTTNNELAYGANLELTFAADLGTYTDIKLTSGYVASYDVATYKMTISKDDKSVIDGTNVTITINVMNGSTTVYSTSNKYFGQKASEGAVADGTNVKFSVVKPTIATSTTATEFNKSINTPIAITFDRAVTGYKVLLLNGSTTYTKYDDVVANDAEIIIPSATATSTDGKTLTVTPAGIYEYNANGVTPKFYTANGDKVDITVSTYSFASLEKYLTALSATANSITASISSKSVKDTVYTATFDFTPEYAYTKSGSTNTYKLYGRATNIRGIVGEWTLYKNNIGVTSNDISIAKTATTSATGKFVDLSEDPDVTDKSVDFLLVTTVDNLEKSCYIAGFADTTKPTLATSSDVDYNTTTSKWTMGSAPIAATIDGTAKTTTYIINTSEPIVSVGTPKATFTGATTATVSATLAKIGDESFKLTVSSTKAADTFVATDTISLTFTDYAGNVSEAQIVYCK